MSEQRQPAEEYAATYQQPKPKLKWVVFIVALVLAAAAAGYTVGVGQGNSRLTHAESANKQLKDEVATLTSRSREADRQLAHLERGKIMDEQALNQARKMILDLETQAAALKSDLTFYKNIMAPSETSKGLQVNRLSLVSQHQTGIYNFKLVLTQVGNNKSYISGLVAVNIIGMRDGEKEVIALRDVSGDIEDLGVKFRFRYFQDVEGELSLPERFEPLEVQVVAQAKGRKSAQAERTFDWSALTKR